MTERYVTTWQRKRHMYVWVNAVSGWGSAYEYSLLYSGLSNLTATEFLL